LIVLSISVGISELNLGEGSSSSRIVDDLLDDSLDVSISLSEIERSVLSRSLSVVSVSLEDSSRSLSLS